MTASAPMLVTLTALQLREIVREEVRDALASHQAPAESDWMSVEEACRHVGVTSQTLRRHVPPSGRVGGKLRYRRSALDSWVESRRLRIAK